MIGLFCFFFPQLAFGAAILNIQIPLMLGDLVNVVARYLRENTGNYVHEIRGPALKLLGLYGIQVSTREISLVAQLVNVSQAQNKYCNHEVCNYQLYKAVVLML